MENKIKSITVVATNYPSPGRMNLPFVQQLVHAMIEQGVKVTVVAPQSIVHSAVHKEKLLSKKSKGYTNSGIEYDIYRPYSLSFGNRNHIRKFTSWFNINSVERILNTLEPNVIYTHFWGATALVYNYATKNKLPLFVACGESGDHLEGTLKNFSASVLKDMLVAVMGVVSVSTENKHKCIEHSLAKAENIEVFPNCINADIFVKSDASEMKKQLGIGENDFVLAFVGGFIPRKGPDRVAKAITKLNDPNIKVMFIGKPFAGYDYDFDCPGIIHKGPLDHDMLPKYLNCANAFVLPTQSEGCCNAIVEALAIGLPVISSKGAFNDDILDKNNSIRVNPDDVDAIADAIKKLKDNPELCKKMSEYSIARHDEYSIEGRAKRILDFINRKINLDKN